MAIYTGLYAKIYWGQAADKFTLTGTSTIDIYSQADSGPTSPMDDSRQHTWMLRLNRPLVETTPKRSDAYAGVPGYGSGVCMIRGWVDSAVDPGAFNSVVATLMLYPNYTNSTTKYWTFQGWVVAMDVGARMDGPNSIEAIIRSTGMIEKKWA